MYISKNVWNNQDLINSLLKNEIVVMPTDTIYGLVGKALNKNTVNRIYEVKKRKPDKPCIILIDNIENLKNFSINLSDRQKEKIKEYWSFDNTQDFQPRAVSIILDCLDNRFEYLHRGTNTLAFRLPVSQILRDLLSQTGPLIAPSANPEALPPSKNIDEAKEYFKNLVDLYIDGGVLEGKHSKLIKLERDGSVVVLRE